MMPLVALFRAFYNMKLSAAHQRSGSVSFRIADEAALSMHDLDGRGEGGGGLVRVLDIRGGPYVQPTAPGPGRSGGVESGMGASGSPSQREAGAPCGAVEPIEERGPNGADSRQ